MLPLTQQIIHIRKGVKHHKNARNRAKANQRRSEKQDENVTVDLGHRSRADDDDDWSFDPS